MALGVTAAAITFAIAGSAHAYPTDWHRIGDGGDGATVYVMPRVWHDQGTNSRRIWERLQAANGEFFVDLTQVNCDSRNTRTLLVTAYDADGNVQGSVDHPTAWVTTTPDTFQDGVVDYACAR